MKNNDLKVAAFAEIVWQTCEREGRLSEIYSVYCLYLIDLYETNRKIQCSGNGGCNLAPGFLLFRYYLQL